MNSTTFNTIVKQLFEYIIVLLHVLESVIDKQGKESIQSRGKIHKIRHMRGTVAGKMFTPGMVQAIMGHKSRKSSESYFHPNEDMATEVGKKIDSKLFQNMPELSESTGETLKITYTKDGDYSCPCCGSTALILKK